MVLLLHLLQPGQMPSGQMKLAHRLVAQARYEIIPGLKTTEKAVTDLPSSVTQVSVTCSPTHGIAATMDLSEALLMRGYRVVPHFAARLVSGPKHTQNLARWTKEKGIEEVFIIGGDSPNSTFYSSAEPFMSDFLLHDSGVKIIGFAAYPDGHNNITKDALNAVLHRKQQLLTDAGIRGLVSTQMCFDASKIKSWLHELRQDGFVLPVLLGVPGTSLII